MEPWVVNYLGVLCDVVEAGDVHAELSSLCELSEANTERNQLITSNTRRLAHHRLAIVEEEQLWSVKRSFFQTF